VSTSTRLASVGLSMALTWGCVGIAPAQSTWNGGASGTWNTAGNWNPSSVPNSSTTDVIIDGNPLNDATVSLNLNASVRDLTIDTGDQLRINNSQQLSIFGQLSNNGLIFVNPTAGASPTTFHAGDDLSLTGTGTLRLGNNNTLAQVTAAADKTITQQAGHTIDGAGNISAALINQGTVRADVSVTPGSANVLQLLTSNMTNTGLFEAAADSTLNINGIAVTNTGGIIRADGANSVVQLSSNAGIVGGTLQTTNGGLINVVSGGGTKSIANLSLNGTLHVSNSATLAAQGTLTNNGLIIVNPTAGASPTTFHAADHLSLTGTGTLRLGNNNTLAQVTAATDKTITQQAGHTIDGRGLIAAAFINQGAVIADVSAGTISLDNGAKTNHGLFRATNSGTMQIASGVLTNLSGSTITGGTYEVMANSTMRFVGGNITTNAATIVLDGVGSNIYNAATGTVSALAGFNNNQGSLTIRNGRNFTTAGNFTNTSNGILRVGDNSTFTVPTGSTLNSAGILAGTGTIAGNVVNTGTIQPGASPGTLIIDGDLLFDTNSIYDWDISDSSHDLIDVLGELTFGTHATLNVSQYGSQPPLPGEYVLFAFAGTAPVLPTWNITMPTGWSHSGVTINGQHVVFGITAVPEPTTLVLLAAGLIGLTRRRRDHARPSL
jgi:hypothetical protein